MKERLRRYLLWLREGAVEMLRLHPVESALILVGCVGCILTYELDWDDLLVRLPLVLLAFALALTVNNLAGCGPWRKVYWVCWTPFVPLAFWSGLEEWLTSEQAMITYAMLVPLALLLSRRALCNGRFVADIIVWLRSGMLAALFANVALGLFAAIVYSTTYIFGLEGRWIEDVMIYALILLEVGVMPVLFLMMSDRWSGAECTGNRILEVLLNYIVGPAVLIYTCILFLYGAKILVTWSLPEGGVAYLVFWFTISALAVQALQQLLDKRMYDWFFDRFSLVSLPLQVLFWIGVVRRTNEYGFTEPRVYLVVCGGLMTLSVLLFLSRRSGRYFYICLAGFLAFAALAYVPALRPGRLAVRSQMRRALHAAERLRLLGPDGKLDLQAFSADSLLRDDYRRLYKSLDYVADNDTTLFARFGADMDEVRAAVPRSFYNYVVYGFEAGYPAESNDYAMIYGSGACVVETAGYKVLYADMSSTRYEFESNKPRYRFDNDTLKIDFGGRRSPFSLPGTVLLQAQLQRLGVGDDPSMETLEASGDEMLVYSDDEVLILFDNMQIERRDAVLSISDVTVNSVMTR